MALLSVGLLESVFFLSGLGDEATRLRTLWSVTIPLDITFTVLAWQVTLAQPTAAHARRIWLTLAWAATIVLIGDTFHLGLVLHDPRPELLVSSPVQGGLFALGMFGVTVAMLRHPVPRQARRERVRFWLDSLTVLVGGAVLTFVFGTDPEAATIDVLPVLGGAAVALTALFAAIRLVLTGSAPVHQLPAALMVAAMFLQVVVVWVAPTGEPSTAGYLLAVWPPILVAAGARIQVRQLQRPPARGTRPSREYSALPYAAVAATFGALVATVPHGVTGRLWGVVAGVVTITSLVVIRQLLAFHDNLDLIGKLDGALHDLREHQRRLRHTADHDRLTMLLNRDAFGDRVGSALAADGYAALLLIDLDDFKTINDTLGHTIGDAVLVALADRLTTAVGIDDVVARLGGDEFAVLVRDPDETDALARRILATLSHPVTVDVQRLLVHASIGSATAGDDFAALLRNADIALYEAKDRGKNGYVRYSADMMARLFEIAELGARLREAIEGSEFELLYQPIVEFRSGRIVGTEALVRWRRANGQIIPPAGFIAAAERTGLIVPLGRWVLREACRQAGEWWRDFGDLAPQTMSVNVSGRQLREPDFVDDVAAALEHAGLPPERLNIEMIETAVLDGPQINDTLRKLRELGVRLSLDDFGTAASSLGLLLTVPVTTLKLDRSFVESIATVTRQAAVATAVAQIARALSLDLVAEGIETAEQAELLQQIGYQHAQGFMYHRPLPAQQVAPLWQPPR